MTDHGETVLLVCGVLIIFAAGWIARGLFDATLAMLKAGVTYFRGT